MEGASRGLGYIYLRLPYGVSIVIEHSVNKM